MGRAILLSSMMCLLSACETLGVNEDTFPAKAGSVVCKKIKKCDLGWYESEFSDMSDCEGEFEDAYEDVVDQADDFDCDFEDDEAKECLQGMQQASCEEYYEGDWSDDCENVWDC